MEKVVLFFFFISGTAYGLSWTKLEVEAYSKRRFIALEHMLVMKNQGSRAQQILLQDHDLEGCRALHHGSGGSRDILRCLSFLNRERQLGLTSPGSPMFIKDVNILCRKAVREPQVLKKLIASHAFGHSSKERALWKPCISESWRQVYLTAYANFRADPVTVLSFVRRAQDALPPHFVWSDKISRFINH